MTIELQLSPCSQIRGMEGLGGVRVGDSNHYTMPRGAAHGKSGVASLRTFRCGMGYLKLEHCVDVCAHKKGVKMKDLHTIWGHYHKCTHKL